MILMQSEAVEGGELAVQARRERCYREKYKITQIVTGRTSLL